MQLLLKYDSELALHRSCCHSSKQDGSISSGMWHGWAIRKTRPEPYIRRFAGYPRTGGAAQDVHVAPSYGPWKQTSSHSVTVWTQPGDSLRTENDGSNSWKRLRSMPVMMMSFVYSCSNSNSSSSSCCCCCCSACQSQLPATGAPVSHAALHSTHMTQLYDSYVRSSTLANWKFWIVSFTCSLFLYCHNPAFWLQYYSNHMLVCTWLARQKTVFVF